MASDSTFAGSIPEVYDRYLVPLIFEPYARDLARRLSLFTRPTSWKSPLERVWSLAR